MAWTVFPGWDLALDGIQEADEFLMAMALCMLWPMTVPSRTFMAAK